MSTKKPTHRVSFSTIIGTGDDGKDKLGSPREIGAVWPRANGRGSIMRLDHIPIELTQNRGVIFLNEVRSDA